MNGLLTQKPGRDPVAGETKNFVLEQRTGKSGKPWTKIRNASADNPGITYRIVSVKPTGYEDDHGNVSFNLEIEPSDGSQPREVAPQRAGNGGWSDDRSNRIERQHSQSVAVAYATLKGLTNITPQEMMALIDWWHRDVSRMPAPPQSKATPEPEMDEEMMAQGDADGEESF